jgi:adenosylcobinamide kinase/adenosylcobinamide-phosphate guanylyltransferase
MALNLDQSCALILGGAKSGKSRYALQVCEGLRREKVFLATARALDAEMDIRIRRHREERGADWQTIEEPLDILKSIQRLDHREGLILVDCLTLWVSNLYMEFQDKPEAIETAAAELAEGLRSVQGLVVLVSNEVGHGIVPDNALSRAYRDTVGSLNQRIAAVAQQVVFMAAGIPMTIKGQSGCGG